MLHDTQYGDKKKGPPLVEVLEKETDYKVKINLNTVTQIDYSKSPAPRTHRRGETPRVPQSNLHSSPSAAAYSNTPPASSRAPAGVKVFPGFPSGGGGEVVVPRLNLSGGGAGSGPSARKTSPTTPPTASATPVSAMTEEFVPEPLPRDEDVAAEGNAPFERTFLIPSVVILIG